MNLIERKLSIPFTGSKKELYLLLS